MYRKREGWTEKKIFHFRCEKVDLWRLINNHYESKDTAEPHIHDDEQNVHNVYMWLSICYPKNSYIYNLQFGIINLSFSCHSVFRLSSKIKAGNKSSKRNKETSGSCGFSSSFSMKAHAHVTTKIQFANQQITFFIFLTPLGVAFRIKNLPRLLISYFATHPTLYAMAGCN